MDVRRAAEVARVPSAGRVRAFRIIAWVMAWSAVAFGLFTLFGVAAEGQEIHRFHNVVVAGLLLLLSAPPVIAAARGPKRAGRHLVHLVALGVAGAATMVLGLRVDVFTLPFIVLTGALLWLRVARGPAIGRGRASIALGVLVAAAAVPLIGYALGQAELQRLDSSTEHAELNHWVETSFYAIAILLLGALAALRPAAFRVSAWSAGVALVVLGGASLGLQGYASALDAPWAWVAFAGGLAFLVVTEWEVRRTTLTTVPKRESPKPTG